MRLSIQLYTVRDHLTSDLRGTLEKLKDIGYEYVELAGTYGKSADEWKTMLAEIGLKVSGSHTGLSDLENNLEATIADAKTLGNPYLFIPWIGEDAYSGGWDKFAHRVEGIGRKVKDAGLALGYHNHAFEFAGSGEKPGLDVFYESSSPDLVKAELDLAWVQIGGANPAEYIRKTGDRVRAVHLKDFDPDAKPQWVPAGKGKLDFEPCLQACKDLNVDYGVVELDEAAGDPLDAVAESFRYFAARGLR